MRKILVFSTVILLGLIAFPSTPVIMSAPTQMPVCSNKWFEVRPGSLIPGPLLAPGTHYIWIGTRDPQKGTVTNWQYFGPFQVNAGTKYLAVMRQGQISGLMPNDAAISSYSNPGNNVASIYYQNKTTDGAWYAVCTQLVRPAPPPPQQTPPCSNKWFEVRPGSLVPGPLLTPGMHTIWLGRRDPQKGTITNWRSFGPFQVNAGTKYLAVMRQDRMGGLLPNDAAISSYSNPGKNMASIYYQNKTTDGAWYAICTQLMPGTSPPPPPPPTDTERVIFNSGNTGGVGNGPTQPTVFTINQAHFLTLIQNYHWNSGRGARGGSIGLRGSDGKMYGPWAVTTVAGYGGAPNVYWNCSPKVVIPAGTYTVIDSDTATWSQNGRSGGRGFSLIMGYPTSQKPRDTTGDKRSVESIVTALFENKSGENVHIFAEGETMSPANRLAPGESRRVNVKMPPAGRIKFFAGRNGQVIASKFWECDPENLSRYPTVRFSNSGQLIVLTSLR